MGETVAIIHLCCFFLIAFDSCHTTMTFSKKFLISLHPSQSSIRQVPSASWHYISTLTYIQFIPKIKIAFPQIHDSFGVMLFDTITTVRKPKWFLTNLAKAINSRCGQVDKASDYKTEVCWIKTRSILFLQIKIQIKNANHIDSTRYQLIHRTISNTLMYRPNLTWQPLSDHRSSSLLRTQFQIPRTTLLWVMPMNCRDLTSS